MEWETRYFAATELVLNNFDDWKREGGWEIENRGIRGIYHTLCQHYALSDMSEQVFRQNFGSGRNTRNPRSVTIYRSLEKMIEDCGYGFNEDSNNFVPRDEILFERERISMDEKLGFLAPATKGICIVQSYLGDVTLFCQFFEKIHKKNPELEFDILLPNPDGIFPKNRNLYPHPEAHIPISSRIKENIYRLGQSWEKLNRPPNFRLWLCHKDVCLPFCIYGRDGGYLEPQDKAQPGIYLYAPFWNHKWADHGPFQTSNGRQPFTQELEASIYHLIKNAEPGLQ